MASRGQRKVIGSDGKAYWRTPNGERYPVGSHSPNPLRGVNPPRISEPEPEPEPEPLSLPARIDAARNIQAVKGQKVQALPQTLRTGHPSVLRERLREGAEGRMRAYTIQEAIKARDAYIDMMYAAYVKVTDCDPRSVVLNEVVHEDGSRAFYFAEQDDGESRKDAY
jgi:hypothetical protein